jgi:hypothetical protein
LIRSSPSSEGLARSRQVTGAWLRRAFLRAQKSSPLQKAAAGRVGDGHKKQESQERKQDMEKTVKCVVCDKEFIPEETFECCLCKKPVCPDHAAMNVFGAKDVDLCDNCLTGEPLEIIHFFAGYCNTLNEIIDMYRHKVGNDLDQAVAKLFADIQK